MSEKKNLIYFFRCSQNEKFKGNLQRTEEEEEEEEKSEPCVIFVIFIILLHQRHPLF